MKTYNTPKHLSYSFELNLNKLPAKKSDRLALRITYPGMLMGLFLIALGLYEWVIRFSKNGKNYNEIVPANEVVKYQSFMNPTFFDFVLVALGLWIIFSLFISYLKYRKISFDGKNFEIVDRPVFGSKKHIKEPLKNYEGVLFRIEFFQFGFMAKRKYIIELAHKDISKVVPLYISTKDKNIRTVWKEYAKKLKLPALMLTNDGIVSREVEDLDKSIVELVKNKVIKVNKDTKLSIPSSVTYTRKNSKTIVKVRKIMWDLFSFVNWVLAISLSVVLIALFVLQMKQMIQPRIEVYIFGILVVLAYMFSFFRKEKIVIKKHKIVLVYKFMLFSRKKNELIKSAVEAVDILFNPVSNRHYLAISTDEKTVIFGEKLPVKELKWVRDFLIKEIAG